MPHSQRSRWEQSTQKSIGRSHRGWGKTEHCNNTYAGGGVGVTKIGLK